ncbi:MAG: hypothetical protein OHK0013_13590 [Sandaracinaceae bacterium]
MIASAPAIARLLGLGLALLGIVLGLGAAGCDCGSGGGATRCATRTPMLAEPVTIGSVTLTPDGRSLTITGLEASSRWSVARGPVLAVDPVAPAMDAIEAQTPDAVLLLGGFDTGPRLAELVDALSELEVPVLLLPGPRDHVEEIEEVLAERGARHLVSLAGFQLVRAGAVQLVLAPGGMDPRYLPDPEGCSMSETELADAIDASDASLVRFLVGFDAPAGAPLTAGIDGVEAGSEAVRRRLEQAGIRGGLFAGPDGRPGVPFDGAMPSRGPSPGLRLIVPPLLGPSPEGPDGARPSAGPTLVVLGPQGLAVPPTHP